MDALAESDVVDPTVGWSVAERSAFDRRGWRDLRAGEKPTCSAIVRPADYVDDTRRGTVEFHAEVHNYSYHSVLIPDGTIVSGCNLSFTTVIGARIVFIDCNLFGATFDPSCDASKGCLVV